MKVRNIHLVTPRVNTDLRKDTLSSLCESFRNFYVLLRVVGLMPLKVVKNEDNVIFIPGKGEYLYISFYFTLYCSLTSFALYAIITEKERKNIVPQIVIFILSAILASLMFMTLLFSFIFRSTVYKVLKLTADTDDTFKTIDIDITYKTTHKNSFILLCVFGVSALVRTILNWIAIDVNIVQQLVIFLAISIKSLCKYSFILFILPIHSRFVKINNVIKSYFTNANVKLTNLNLDSGNVEMLKKLYMLCRLHYRLCNISRTLNVAFAFQLLFSLGVSLSNILFQSYFLYNALSNKYNQATIPMMVSPVIWLLDEIMEVYLLVYACANTCEEVRNYISFLNKIQNNNNLYLGEQHTHFAARAAK